MKSEHFPTCTCGQPAPPYLPVLLLFRPVKPSLARVHVLGVNFGPEEHVEQLLRRKFRLESTRVRVVVVVARFARRRRLMVLLRAVQIVRAPLLRVGQDGDRIADRFKCFHRAGRMVFVRVELQRQLLVRFLDVRIGRILRYAQHLVVIFAPAPKRTHKKRRTISV